MGERMGLEYTRNAYPAYKIFPPEYEELLASRAATHIEDGITAPEPLKRKRGNPACAYALPRSYIILYRQG